MTKAPHQSNDTRTRFVNIWEDAFEIGQRVVRDWPNITQRVQPLLLEMHSIYICHPRQNEKLRKLLSLVAPESKHLDCLVQLQDIANLGDTT